MQRVTVAIAGGLAAGKRTLCQRIGDEIMKNHPQLKTQIIPFQEVIQPQRLDSIRGDLLLVHGLVPFLDGDHPDPFDIKIFLDVEADIRLIRILLRNADSKMDKLIDRYLIEDRFFHRQFVLKQRPKADFHLDSQYSQAHILKIIRRIEQIQRNEK